MQWLTLLTELLPVIGSVVEKIHGDLAAHHKQQIVADTLAAAAASVAKIAPQYSNTASDAATVATAVTSGVAQVVADAKAGDVASAVTDSVGTAVTAVAGATAIQEEVNAPVPPTAPVLSSPIVEQQKQ